MSIKSSLVYKKGGDGNDSPKVASNQNSSQLYMQKARAIKAGEGHYYPSLKDRKAGTNRIQLEGDDLELAAENRRRQQLSIEQGYDGYPYVTARTSGDRPQYTALDRKSKAEALARHGDILNSAGGADPSIWSSNISQDQLDFASKDHADKKKDRQEYNATYWQENKEALAFRKVLENGEYTIVGKQIKMLDANLKQIGWAGLYHSLKKRKYKVVHCGPDGAPSRDDRGNYRLRDFPNKADADIFFNDLIESRLPHNAFYSLESYDDIIKKYMIQIAQIQEITTLLNQRRSQGEIDDSEFDKLYNLQTKDLDWSWLPRNLCFIVALASNIRGPLPEKLNKNRRFKGSA